MQKNLLVLFGGCSSEYEVSLQSAHAALTHIDSGKYRLLPVGITRQGRWLYYTGDAGRLPKDTWQEDSVHCTPCTLRLDRGAAALLLLDGGRRALPIDGAFPVLHGKNGEDGTVQGLLELADVPIVGCGALSSALCMDKHRAHTLAALAGIKVPRSAVFDRNASQEEWEQAAAELGYPLFVKPVRAGSSIGITRAARADQLAPAVEQAFRHDREILLEEAVSGFEVGCAVLGSDTLEVGEVDEIELFQGFFDFEEKYTLKTSAIHCPARISTEKALEIQAAAKKVYRALNCRVFARADFFLTPDGEILFNEINTIPGLTAHSRYPKMMEAAGLDFSTLLDRLIQLGMEG